MWFDFNLKNMYIYIFNNFQIYSNESKKYCTAIRTSTISRSSVHSHGISSRTANFLTDYNRTASVWRYLWKQQTFNFRHRMALTLRHCQNYRFRSNFTDNGGFSRSGPGLGVALLMLLRHSDLFLYIWEFTNV